MARWIKKLQEYHFDIIHRPGRKHSNADSLSRLPCYQCGRDSHVSASTVAATTVSDIPVLQHHSTESLRQGQIDDATIGLVLKALELNSKPTATTLQGCSPAVRRLIQLWDQLELHNGLLYRRFVDKITEESHLQLIVPLCYRNEILQELHAGVVGRHLGQDKAALKSVFIGRDIGMMFTIDAVLVLLVLPVRRLHLRCTPNFNQSEQATLCN